jgi:hypothetical protein
MSRLVPTVQGQPPAFKSTAHISETSAEPKTFAVLSTDAPINKKSKKAKEPSNTVPRLSGKPWFDENFSGYREDVIQLRVYPKRGFKCAPCGITGNKAYVIRGKDGKGNQIEVFNIDPVTGKQTLKETINGFEVGYTCLKKYGNFDVEKMRSDPEYKKRPVDTVIAETSTD